MPNLSVTEPNLRSLLDSLPSKGRLFDVARHFGVAVPPKGTKVELTGLLALSPQLGTRALIEWMGRDELRLACQRHGLTADSRARTQLAGYLPRHRANRLRLRSTNYLEDELGFDKAAAGKIVTALAKTKSAEEALEALEPLSGRTPERAAAGTLVIQPGPERRRTSSHYTPRELTEPIVERTLEPLIKAMGEAPASEALLNLVVCDPAMGSGAFLVAACRYLADHVVAAWTREGRLEVIADAHDDVVNHARRLVAQRCLYGVDKNKYAVQLARLSLWLVTMAREEPFTFVDHALRHGDSLVGLNFDQLRAFHWKPDKQVETSANLLKEALDEAIGIRQHILELASEGTLAAQREKERLLLDAEDALDRVRLIGDLVIGAFFSQAKDKDREKERNRRLDLVEQWLGFDRRGDSSIADEILAELRTLQTELKRTQVPFHWMVEFPEVFYAERPDPLDGNRRNGAAYVEAFVGNPPFMGGSGIWPLYGACYRDWLLMINTGSHGNADLCAHFFRLAASLIGRNGTIGMVATNTISQGDTRRTGLQNVVTVGGCWIYAVDVDVPWAGDAAVTVSVVHLARGSVSFESKWYCGRRVDAICSLFRPIPERPDPVVLSSNHGCGFLGAKLYGQGFLLTEAERDSLVNRNSRSCQRIFSYIGGEEVNTSPTQSPDKFAINLSDVELSEAEAWPELLDVVRQRVKPERDVMGGYSVADSRREKWWKYGTPASDLRSAIQNLKRCLVTARVTKHLCFSFQPTDRIFNEKLYVFPLECWSALSVMQSRLHSAWAWLLSSTLETRLNYSASDCFVNFPFPRVDPRAKIPGLDAIGEELYASRSQFMVETQQGLTKTYNALKDPANEEPRIIALRVLHEALDRAVLDAYGWTDIAVPPYCPKNNTECDAANVFEDKILDRLFALNVARAADERAASVGLAKSVATSKTKKPAEDEQKTPPKAAKKKAAKSDSKGQGSLF